MGLSPKQHVCSNQPIYEDFSPDELHSLRRLAQSGHSTLPDRRLPQSGHSGPERRLVQTGHSNSLDRGQDSNYSSREYAMATLPTTPRSAKNIKQRQKELYKDSKLYGQGFDPICTCLKCQVSEI